MIRVSVRGRESCALYGAGTEFMGSVQFVCSALCLAVAHVSIREGEARQRGTDSLSRRQSISYERRAMETLEVSYDDFTVKRYHASDRETCLWAAKRAADKYGWNISYLRFL